VEHIWGKKIRTTEHLQSKDGRFEITSCIF